MKKFLFSLSLILLCYSPVSAEQDCDVMKNKDTNVTLGFKAGTILMGVGPEIAFRDFYGIQWRGNIQYMIAEYEELCSRYNTGRMTKEEYDKEIQNIISRSRRYEQEVAERFRMKKELMFNELKGVAQ
tara:strand:+ start:536 stop:919 length:384 start_codon:yes stop_codon:yes gene_type:complete